MRYVLALLLALCFAGAQEYPFDASLYDAAALTVNVEVSSTLTLVGSGRAESLEATLHYIPEEADTLQPFPPPISLQPLVFSWHGVGVGEYPFGYTAVVETSVNRPRLHRNVAYPFSTPPQLTAYLHSQEITDTNQQIRRQAQELTTGKTDSMEVVFALASWVHENIQYNLSSLTAQASQPSSWVYEERYGVCDELTSLFISMSREAGIPARFVSGLAYTNQFVENWGPHGWAEVWLPEVGWLPVDVTYGEIGYVDATHIPIRHSLDAKNTAVDYSLLSRSLTMRASELTMHVDVLERSGDVHEPLRIELEPLYERVGSGSANMLTATIYNDAAHYVATDLYLAATPDTVLHEKQRQQVLLPPRSAREVSWRISHGDFRSGYEYTIPFTVIAQRAGNASASVHGSANGQQYPTLPDVESVSGIPVDCDEPALLYRGESTSVTCSAPGAQLCTTTCAQDSITLDFEATEAGAFPQLVTATRGDQRGSAVVTFVVDAPPHPSISATLPTEASFHDILSLSFSVSTSTLTNAKARVVGNHFNHEWDVGELREKGFELRFPATYLDPGENELRIIVTGTDKNGDQVTGSSSAAITLHATTWQSMHLFLLHLFT